MRDAKEAGVDRWPLASQRSPLPNSRAKAEVTQKDAHHARHARHYLIFSMYRECKMGGHEAARRVIS